MTQRTLTRYRWARRLAIFMAAAPLFQFAQCATGTRQVADSMLQAMPSTIFSIMQSFFLLPLQLIFGGASA